MPERFAERVNPFHSTENARGIQRAAAAEPEGGNALGGYAFTTDRLETLRRLIENMTPRNKTTNVGQPTERNVPLIIVARAEVAAIGSIKQ